MLGIIVGFWLISLAVTLSVLGLVGYVAWHFITKFW